ncbi:MAG: pyridoxamine 5'-phosphate oxidase family protein [Rhodobacteraceae bacterium]|nr:pyridoxamine 5'-phosphate oxidase family protein [Paracoccaceae bacterium]
MPRPDPFQPADETARTLARTLMAEARFGALAVLRDGAPFVTRIALAPDPTGGILALVSDLAPHTGALRADPLCALLVGEPGPKGDPLTHPRLSIQARAHFISRDAPNHATLRAAYLAHQPKAQLYIDFADFHLVHLAPLDGHLNGGFGRAFRLTADDLTRP